MLYKFSSPIQKDPFFFLYDAKIPKEAVLIYD